MMKAKKINVLLPEAEGFPRMDLADVPHDQIYDEVVRKWKEAYEESWEDIR